MWWKLMYLWNWNYADQKTLLGKYEAVKSCVSFEGEIRYAWEADPKLFTNKPWNLDQLITGLFCSEWACLYLDI